MAQSKLPETGTLKCENAGINKASWDVVLEKRKLCRNDYEKPEECNNGEGKQYYDEAYVNRSKNLSTIWLSYDCESIVYFSSRTQSNLSEVGSTKRICKNAGINDAGWDMLFEKQDLCKNTNAEECADGQGKQLYDGAYESRTKELNTLWPEYGCDNIDSFNFLAQSKASQADSTKSPCEKAGINKAGWNMASEKNKMCEKEKGIIYKNAFLAANDYCELPSTPDMYSNVITG
jgi:hypothetical protein